MNKKHISFMKSSNSTKKKIYKSILKSYKDGEYPLFSGIRFFFREGNNWIAIDNSDNNCFVEEFKNLKDAIYYLKNGSDPRTKWPKKPGYIDELHNEDGDVYFLKEKYTKEEAIFLSKDYEDETFPYTEDPDVVHMRPATDKEITENHYGPGWYIELDQADSDSKEYWKFVPDMFQKFAELTGVKV